MQVAQEIWEPVPYNQFRDMYAVSSLGRVRNSKTMRILKPMRTGPKGSSKQRSKVRFSTIPRIDFDIANLVLTAFIGQRPTGMLALHKLPDTTNNALSNLYWGTPVDNMQDMVRQARGGNQKLNSEQVAEIRKRRAAGERGRKLSVEYNISEQRICDIHKGRTSL